MPVRYAIVFEEVQERVEKNRVSIHSAINDLMGKMLEIEKREGAEFSNVEILTAPTLSKPRDEGDGIITFGSKDERFVNIKLTGVITKSVEL